METDIRSGIGVSIVMPCLNEARCLPVCIELASEALAAIQCKYGLTGEIIIADNGSTDGSQFIAMRHGARVVDVPQRGYGAALIHGMRAAAGEFLVMGDADGSYDFRQSVPMIGQLLDGADLCMGSRFKGEIKPGAMPWKNRYIGNPAMTWILNLLFRAGVSDTWCGLRALRRSCFDRLRLSGQGMEFACEMVIKAALKGEHITEVPITLSPDLRDRAPHLRPWRDGWRGLRYFLMLSPTWAFAMPAALMGIAALAIWATAIIEMLVGAGTASLIGNYWVILAGALFGLSHMGGILAAATHLYGRRQGYRRASGWSGRLARWISLETMLLAGGAVFALGLVILLSVVGYWSHNRFQAIASVLPAVVGTTLVVLGAQNVLGGFLLSVISGNEAGFLRVDAASMTLNRQPHVDQAAAPRAVLN